MANRRVKIVCTLGPSSRDRKTLLAMARAGMDVARLNFSHGTHDEHAAAIRLVREVASEVGRPIGILADLSGPKIRVGDLPGGERRLRRGEEVVLSSRLRPRREGVIGTSYRRLARDLRRGRTVLLDDGRLSLEVMRVDKETVRCRVVEGGVLRSHKGINLPGAKLSAPALTSKDKRDLTFALEQGVDLVALSFVRKAGDVRRAAQLAARFSDGEEGGRKTRSAAIGAPFEPDHAPIIAKLEKPEALEDLDEILAAAGGVMVARGDLGVEIAPECVPGAQKRIIRRALETGRPVITATQMLESMTETTRPTRAEASDVANAVLDRTDAVMLSAETASGKHPVQVVRMMDRIVRETETSSPELRAMPERRWSPSTPASSPEGAVSRAAVTLALSLRAAAIVAFTASGATAVRIARLRPDVPIVAFTPDERVARRLTLVWGVTPRAVRRTDRLNRLVARTDRALRDLRLAKRGDRVVLVMGYPIGSMGQTNLVKIHVVGETD